MKILPKSELLPAIEKLFQQTRKSIKLSSAWLKGELLERLISNSKKNLHIQVIIRASSLEDLLTTDEILFKIAQNSNIQIYLHPSLHSKFFIFDDKYAIVGSSNLTFSGICQDGNEETDIFIDDKTLVSQLIDLFESLKDKSVTVDDIKGFVVSSDGSSSSNLVLLDESIIENNFLTFKKEDKTVISRVSSILSIPVNSLSISDNKLSMSLLEDVENISKLFSKHQKNWQKSAFLGYFNEKHALKVAKLENLCVLDENSIENEAKLQPVLTPLEVGDMATVDDKLIEKVFNMNHAGYEMSMPVKFGKVLNTDLDAKLDFEKITSMHMAVIGITGSGKTTFVKRVIENLSYDVHLFIFDLYNEYSSFPNATTVNIPSTIFPITYENIREIFRTYGITFQEKTKEEKYIAGLLRRYLKPDADFIEYKNKNLDEILKSCINLIKEDITLKAELIYLLDILKSDYGSKAISNQKSILNLIKKAVNNKNKFLIFNFSEVEDQQSKTNLAGIILKEIFKKAKKQKGKYTVVLEEAHNFAPEKAAYDVSPSKDNLAFSMARKIALEGRKLNLGLIAITQRPANISKYVLSQLNTQVILKLANKNDLEAVSVFFEENKKEIFDTLPYLKPGYLYITGLAVPFGFMAKIKLG